MSKPFSPLPYRCRLQTCRGVSLPHSSVVSHKGKKAKQGLFATPLVTTTTSTEPFKKGLSASPTHRPQAQAAAAAAVRGGSSEMVSATSRQNRQPQPSMGSMFLNRPNQTGDRTWAARKCGLIHGKPNRRAKKGHRRRPPGRASPAGRRTGSLWVEGAEPQESKVRRAAHRATKHDDTTTRRPRTGNPKQKTNKNKHRGQEQTQKQNMAMGLYRDSMRISYDSVGVLGDYTNGCYKHSIKTL